MSTGPCDNGGQSECSDDGGGGSNESVGVWIGIAAGGWIFLMILVWLLRTCTNHNRREQAVHKVRRMLCLTKETDNPPPVYGSGTSQAQSSGPVYYNPSRPPSYHEAIKDSAQTQAGERGRNQQPEATTGQGGHDQHTDTQLGRDEHGDTQHTQSHHDADERRHAAANGVVPHGVPNSSRHHPRGLGKSRSTLSMLSISLEPIEESEDATPDIDSAQASARRKPSVFELPTASPSRSKSHPARLGLLSLERGGHFQNTEKTEEVVSDKHDASEESRNEIPKRLGYYLGRTDSDESIEDGHSNTHEENKGRPNVAFTHGSDEETIDIEF